MTKSKLTQIFMCKLLVVFLKLILFLKRGISDLLGIGCAFLLIFQAPVACAQLNSNITRYSTEDGLSHDGVLCITRDKDGFMWFGTWDGINRFDGHDFVTYKSRPGDNSNLRNNKIRNIVEDKDEYLWVETYDSKLYRFDKKTEKFLAISDGNYRALFKDVVITKIIPDSDGGVWLLTENQGALYAVNDDSGTPVIYQYTKNKTGGFKISGNVISFLFRDPSNRVWIGTEGGINCLKKDQGDKYVVSQMQTAVSKILSSYSFTCYARNSRSLFFGTSDGHLMVYDLASGTCKVKELSKGTKLNAICNSKAGLLYISTTGKGLITLDPLRLKFTYAGLFLKDTYYTLYEDRLGQIWIEPAKSGIIKYDPRNGKFKSFTQQKDFISASRDYQVITDANGTLWASMKGGGFGYYNPATDDIDYFHDEPGSTDQKFSNILTSLFIDKTGVLWISAKDGGLNKVISLTDKFNYRRLVDKPKIRSENDIRALMKDKKGRLWLCTKAGEVYVYENGNRVNLFSNSDGKLGNVYTMLEDSKGNIWLGTKGNGLFKAAPLKADQSLYALHNYKSDEADNASISSNQIYSIIEDHKGRIWIGTLGGGLNLLSASGNKIQFINHRNSFKYYPFSTCNVIRHLREDTQGKIWIATTNGLLIFDPDKGNTNNYHFLNYRKIPGDHTSLGNNNVQYIHKDNSGQMWVGTFGGGLNKVITDKNHPGKMSFKVYTTENGLSNDVVLSITNDKNNDLWIATESGLSKFDPRKDTFKNYDFYDGLPNVEFSEATCFADPAGRLYFGCIDGYISFDPSEISDQKINAEMALTRIQLYYKNILPGAAGSPLKYAINESKELVLDHDQNVISIDYAVLDYRAVNKITYAYKLEGFDQTWHHVNDQRKATYTNIPPGKYLFKVKATNGDLFKNVPQKMLRIIVKPPFYLTIWAYLVYLILIIIAAVVARRIIITMIRLRNKVLVEQKLTEVKLSFFTNISHELRTPLTLIVSPLEEISRTELLSDKGRDYLNIVNRNANRMIRFINQLLDFRKIQSGKMYLHISEVDILHLVRNICSHFTGMAEEKNIAFTIHAEKEHIYAWVDEEKVDIIIYNLLSNAFKFTPAFKSIRVEVNYVSDTKDIEIKIIDEGKGVPKDKLTEIFEIYYEGNTPGDHNLKGTGIGLALSRELAISHHGKLSAKNNLNEGMTFILELKGGKEHFDATEVKFEHAARGDEFINADLPVSAIDVSAENMQATHTPLVLIVEDNPELRSFLSLKLEGLYRIKNAADGFEGLSAAIALLPDLIISDLMMPNMDGIQMLDQLKNDVRTSHIPVILLTAKSSVENQVEGLKYGADLYITKPFHTDYLLASVENLIQSRKKLFEQLSDGIDKRVLNLEPGEIVITSRDEVFLKDAIKIVEEGMSNPDFNIEEVATAIGMGRTTFYKKLKSLTSLSPVEFVRDMRLKRSKQLLDAGMQTVSEIGYLVGFNSLPYFSTCFKEKYKMSPSEYLKKIRTGEERNKAD